MSDVPAHVALGDSISIDDHSGGPGRGGAGLPFANRNDDFPEWRGRDLRTREPGTTFLFLATDGATTHTLLEAQLPRLPEIAARLAPSGRLVLGTVHDPTDGTGDAARPGLPPWPDAGAVIDELNDSLREVAARNGAAVAEIAAAFRGHGLLAGDPTQRHPRPSTVQPVTRPWTT
jgi:hypothetical protein